MEKIKHFVLNFPEVYFLVLVLLAAYTPPFQFSPLIILAFLILLQLYTAGIKTGVALTLGFSFINLYMLLALFSEYFEFEESNLNAIKLISFGLSLFISSSFFIWLMAKKYFIFKQT